MKNRGIKLAKKAFQSRPKTFFCNMDASKFSYDMCTHFWFTEKAMYQAIC